MISFYMVWFLAFLWLFFAKLKEINDNRGITQDQRADIENTFFIISVWFAALLMVELFFFSKISKSLNNEIAMTLILFFNGVAVFFYPKGGSVRENRKIILAKSLSNFSDLPSKKVIYFSQNLKKETSIDLSYHLLKTIHKKNDLTVSEVVLDRAVLKTEFDLFFTKELNKDFKDNLIYMKLIQYANESGAAYGVPKTNYSKLLEQIEKKKAKRWVVEKFIVSKFLQLKEKKIPIRISQLLQYADEPYLKNFIYFLMSIESLKFTPNAVLYAIFFAKKGVIK